MKLTNKNVCSINKTLATVTKRLPINITVTRKPSKVETALTIIGGLAMYAVGVGIMLKANEPTYIQMPTFQHLPTIPETDDENDKIIALVKELAAHPYVFVGDRDGAARSLNIARSSIFPEPRLSYISLQNGWLSYQLDGEWESSEDVKLIAAVNEIVQETAKEIGDFYRSRANAKK